MTKFKRPQLLTEPGDASPSEPDPEAIARFATAGNERRLEFVPSKPKHPWESHDPDASRERGMNLRLNQYELELLHFVAKLERVTAQQAIRRILLPELERMAKEHAEK